MNDFVSIDLAPNTRALLQRAPLMGAAITDGIRRAMDEQNQLTIGHAQRFKLSKKGPTTLGVITNRLRSSLAAFPARIVRPGVVESAIGSNVKYAGAHEQGFVGRVNVRAHDRRRFGTIMQGGTAFLDPVSGRIRKAKKSVVRQQTGTVSVRAFTRQMKMPARSFIRSSLQERGPSYDRAFFRAITTALNGPAAS